jgi:hypothetical protein
VNCEPTQRRRRFPVILPRGGGRPVPASLTEDRRVGDRLPSSRLLGLGGTTRAAWTRERWRIRSIGTAVNMSRGIEHGPRGQNGLAWHGVGGWLDPAPQATTMPQLTGSASAGESPIRPVGPIAPVLGGDVRVDPSGASEIAVWAARRHRLAVEFVIGTRRQGGRSKANRVGRSRIKDPPSSRWVLLSADQHRPTVSTA